MPEPTPAPIKRTRNRSTAAGNSRTISLHSGGTLTVSGTFNFLDLTSADREFIFQLADLMTKYQRGAGIMGPSTVPGPAAPSAPAKGVN